MEAIRKAISIPAVESAIGALVGAIAADRAAKMISRRKHGYDREGAGRTARWIGAIVGGANPWLRDAKLDDLAGSMLTPHRASAGFDADPFLGTVDKAAADRVVNSDLFLQPYERRSVLGIIGQARDTAPGRTSQYELAKSAARAGLEFVPAYTFGQLVGQALGVPEPLARKISRVGALAFAVRSSGLAEQL